MKAACKTCHVFLLSGQSNATGRYPFTGLTGLNIGYATPYGGIQFTERDLNLNTAAIEYDYDWGPVVVKSTSNFLDQRMGSELSLARLLAEKRHSDWSPSDDVALIKFAVGGARLNQFRPFDNTGIHDAFMSYVSEKIADLESQYCEVVCHDFFWIQGESDRTPAWSSTYPTRFIDFENSLKSICDFRTIFSQLQENVTTTDANGVPQGPLAAQINSGMIAAGYATTVNNDDLAIGDVVHYTPDSYMELGKRLYQASL